MRLDASKIDERIQKLQEIKRIAADPELLEMLFEFIDMDDADGFSKPRRTVKMEANRTNSHSDEAGELINRVVRSVSG